MISDFFGLLGKALPAVGDYVGELIAECTGDEAAAAQMRILLGGSGAAFDQAVAVIDNENPYITDTAIVFGAIVGIGLAPELAVAAVGMVVSAVFEAEGSALTFEGAVALYDNWIVIAKIVSGLGATYLAENLVKNTFDNLEALGNDLAPAFKEVSQTIAGLLNKSMIHRDPLVVDLTGAGLKLTSLANSAAEFDYGATGLDTPTGWMGAGAGMLVLPNANGQVVNGQQLFGPATGNGFTELAALDSNHDGIINSSDAQFTSLEIWQDTNGDGVEQSGELETLTQAGIKSISLGTTSVNQTNAGNQVQATATVTFTNNNTTTISEVNFAVDTLNTTINSAAPPSYTLTSAIEALPTVKGYGQMYDLDIAMALDGTLQTNVTNLTNVSAGDFTNFESDVTTSLYEWAGVAGVNSNNRTVANDNFDCNLKLFVHLDAAVDRSLNKVYGIMSKVKMII